MPTSIGALSSGSIAFANNNASLAIPTLFSKSSNSAGFSIFTGTNNVNASPDMRFVVMKEDGTDFTTLTSSAFRFSRYNLSLFDILRNGNVGIGTTAPVGRLNIFTGLTGNTLDLANQQNGSISVNNSSATLAFPTITGKTNDAISGLRLMGATPDTNGNPDMSFDVRMNTNADFSTLTTSAFRFTRYGSALVDISRNGNVGIGTASPVAKFHIVDTNGGVFFDGSNTAYNRFKSTNIAPTVAKPLLFSAQTSGTTPDIYISTSGNVGIGTTIGTNKLDVNGTIHSKEVKVDMTGWSDFVFKNGYELPTLAEVEKHIAEKGHLENIPSEEEVLKNGISLGEMNSKLLQKIEELTLYVIEQNKAIEELKKEVKDIKSKN
ncbi:MULTISPECIES: hypothetical protein [Flavobacterium]|uniref:hypothetical protein n=1 Tax=Flavobacterium TaxID=237 RepID=UPI001EF45056|nr:MULTISPECIES: hypothetical protein [Flavobacterium]MCV2486487.1 hypothetical protein [Flavobacterium sp. SH_e]